MTFARRTHIDLHHLAATQACRFHPRYGMRVLDYDGMAWGPPTTAELVDAVRAFPLDPSDVLVTAFPKSGTNWVQIMLANFWDDWGSYRLTGSRRVPSIEFIGAGTDGYDVAVSSDPPRLMKNHLPAAKMPRTWRTAKPKVVYITRNPFDVCASFHRQLSMPVLEFDADWDRWVDRFVRGDTIYGGWLEHVRGWSRYGHEDGVHHLTYEALSENPLREMRKVVAFLRKPLDDARLEEVVTKALRGNMDASGFSAQITVGDLKYYRSDGQADARRARYSPEQRQRIERELIAPLAREGIAVRT